MKIRDIVETIHVADPDTVLNYLGGAATSLLGRGVPQGQKKVSKTNAQYVEKSPTARTCSNCKNIDATTRMCAVVEGLVHPSGLCKFWAKQESP